MAVSKQEKKWQAEDDARTLERYQEIKSDKGRMKTAKSVLVKRKEEIIKALKV